MPRYWGCCRRIRSALPSSPKLVQRQHEFDGSCGDGLSSLSYRERAGGEGPQRLVKAPHPNPLPEGEGKEWVSQNQRDNALERQAERQERLCAASAGKSILIGSAQ